MPRTPTDTRVEPVPSPGLRDAVLTALQTPNRSWRESAKRGLPIKWLQPRIDPLRDVEPFHHPHGPYTCASRTLRS